MTFTSSKKILIIEDELPILYALTNVFLQHGFYVLGAKDGKEGLDVALTERPDVILLDIIMPKMDGITVLKHLRGNGWGGNVIIIVLTNLSDRRKAEEAMEYGADGYWLKTDFRLKDLVQKVQKRIHAHA